jgi:hypothetical protein
MGVFLLTPGFGESLEVRGASRGFDNLVEELKKSISLSY